jgi:hypothetical protein
MGLVAGENQSAGSSPSVVLQNINDQWFPQSELGAYGFVGGARLIRGEPLFFVDSSFRVYRLVPERPVTWDELKLRWGSEVAKRARNDRKSLVVRLELLS